MRKKLSHLSSTSYVHLKVNKLIAFFLIILFTFSLLNQLQPINAEAQEENVKTYVSSEQLTSHDLSYSVVQAQHSSVTFVKSNFETINVASRKYTSSLSSNGNFIFLTSESLSDSQFLGILYCNNYIFIYKSNLLFSLAQGLRTSSYRDNILLIGSGAFTNLILLKYNSDNFIVDLFSKLLLSDHNFDNANSIAFKDNVFLISGANDAYTFLSFFYPNLSQFMSLINNVSYYFAIYNHNLWNGYYFIIIDTKADFEPQITEYVYNMNAELLIIALELIVALIGLMWFFILLPRDPVSFFFGVFDYFLIFDIYRRIWFIQTEDYGEVVPEGWPLEILYILFVMLTISFFSYFLKRSKKIHFLATISTSFMIITSGSPPYQNLTYNELVYLKFTYIWFLSIFSINTISVIIEGWTPLWKMLRKQSISPRPVSPPYPQVPQPLQQSISRPQPPPTVTPIYPKKLSIIYKDKIIEVKSIYHDLPIKKILYEYGITKFNKVYGFDGFFLKELNLEEKVNNYDIFTIYVQ